MPLRPFALLLFAAASLHAQSTLQSPLQAAPQPSFCAEIESLTSAPSVAEAHWGISVTALDGTSLCALHDAQLFRPASNAKLFTAAAALALLGPARTFTTTVSADAAHLQPLPGGNLPPRLDGNLWLTGSGDANLSTRPLPYLTPAAARSRPDGSDPLAQLADSIAATGLRHITGGIVGDDSAWPYEPFPADWSIDDMLWEYGAPVSALSVYDNKLKLTVTPGPSPGTPAIVTLAPSTPFYEVHASVRTLPRRAAASVALDRQPGSRVLRVFGTVAIGAPYTDDIAISDPAQFAALTLKSMLQARGVQVDGEATTFHALSEQTQSFHHIATQPIPSLLANPAPRSPCRYAACTVLATHTSPPLLEDLTLTLKVSQNLHAELLLHHLAEALGDDGSSAQGCRVVRQFALNAGLNPQDFTLFDGSGLSGHDLVSPRALTQLLVYAAAQPWFPAFKAALPIGGLDGSLAARFPPASPLHGRVFAKTGTLGESRALSGYVLAASGRTLVFSILDDNHAPSSTADRAAMEKIVELIAAAN